MLFPCRYWKVRKPPSPARGDPTRDNPSANARARSLRIRARALLLAFVATAAHGAPAQVSMRVEGDAGSYLVWADNGLAGPVEVRLRSERGDVAGEPELPARATVPANASVLVARVHPGTATGGDALALRMDTVPGSVNARPADYEYLFPLDMRTPRVEQAWGGRYSHDDAENRHAVDFAADPGTTVLAAREGVVMQVEMDGGDESAGARHGRANLVRVLHADGSMAVYAHLAAQALVEPGQRVRRGQPIGVSGDSGFSTGPHLHFAVQVNRGMRLESIPFRMFAPGGILRFSEPAAGGG